MAVDQFRERKPWTKPVLKRLDLSDARARLAEAAAVLESDDIPVEEIQKLRALIAAIERRLVDFQ